MIRFARGGKCGNPNDCCGPTPPLVAAIAAPSPVCKSDVNAIPPKLTPERARNERRAMGDGKSDIDGGPLLTLVPRHNFVKIENDPRHVRPGGELCRFE